MQSRWREAPKLLHRQAIHGGCDGETDDDDDDYGQVIDLIERMKREMSLNIQ